MWKYTTTKVDRRVVIVRVMALVIVMLVLVIAAYLYGRSQGVAALPEEDRESVDLMVEAMNTVRDDYVDRETLDTDEQTYG